MPPATQALLGINVLIYFAGGYSAINLNEFMLWPPGGMDSRFAPWQIVTYAFLHGSFAHIFFNMFGLYMFGSEIERLFGSRFFLSFYLASVVSAALTHLVVTSMMGSPPVPMVGASGGIYGLILAYGMYFPNRRIVLLIPPIPMRARVFVIVFAAIELGLGVLQPGGSVAHFAHLGGMLGGFLMIQYRRGRFPFGKS